MLVPEKDPETRDERRAMSGNKMSGKRNLIFGNLIIPVERVEARYTATKTTERVARNVNFAEYRETKSDGIAKSGRIKTKARRQYLNIFSVSIFLF